MDPQGLYFLSAFFVVSGFMGMAFHHKNLIQLLMCLELMIMGTILQFVVGGALHHQIEGTVSSLFIMAVAAAETTIGLALFVRFYRHRKSLMIHDLSELKDDPSSEFFKL
jgi:NADH-quinone oxidoreductase subunit K